jgi:bacteriophage N4 adsorption protein A
LLYKPLKFHNIYLGAERLFSLGKNSQDDWLLKGLFSWSKGTELKPQTASWNYTSIYSDVGLFLSDPFTTAYYGEVRQGWSFNLRDSFIFTPHLVLNGRWQDPDPDDASYSEGGVGVSVKYLFGETYYETKRFSTELLIQYKVRLDESSDGVAITSVTRF